MDHLRHADLWHTGIVVDDLAGAMTELGAQLGVSWYEGGAEVRMTTEAGTTTVTTSYALSKEGPHHVELGQSIEGTLWTTPPPAHAHHVGHWVDDVLAASRASTRAATRGSPPPPPATPRRPRAPTNRPPPHERPHT